MALEFRDQPPSKGTVKRGDDDYDEIRAELIANSGKWAMVKTFDTSGPAGGLAYNAKHGYLGWVGHHWEATTRLRPDRRYDVWIRHVGAVS